jgi:hypothetical protein
MSLVICNTHKKSKLTYALVIAYLLMISSLFGVMDATISKWAGYCEINFAITNCSFTEHHSHNNYTLAADLCGFCRDGCFEAGMFLFAYRYFEVAEMLGRDDTS